MRFSRTASGGAAAAARRQRCRPTGSDLFARSLRQRLVGKNGWHVIQVSAGA